MPKFGIKNASFGYFWERTLKILASYLIVAPSNFAHSKTFRKKKNSSIWYQKLLVWQFIGWNLNTISYIWNQQPQICLNVKFCERTRMPKFRRKNFWFGYFKSGISKKYCDIWNQQPGISLNEKHCGKVKMPKFGTKNAWFRYFWTGNWKQYLKSALSNLSTGKIWRKNTND